MDKNLQRYLLSNKIEYIDHEHPPVFTVEEHVKVGLKLKCMHTKSLFLKDSKGKFYLVCMDAFKKLDIKFLQKHFYVEKIRFASPEELKEKISLTPGSVSIFGMINDKSHEVFLVIDKSVWESSTVGFHPNINTSTLELNHNNLEKFVMSLSCEKEIIDLPKASENKK